MKTLWALAIGLVLILSASAAYATPDDPTIILRDPPTCVSSISVTCIVASGPFGLQLDNTGGGNFVIKNNSGMTWTNLDIGLLAPSGASLFTCDGFTFFQNCSVGITGPGPNGTNMVDAFFSGLGPCQNDQADCEGIPDGGFITFHMDTPCAAGATCGNWEPNSMALVTPNFIATPEPESIVLLLTGFLPLLPLRKRLFGSRHSA
ncbi:MAG: hypothetical protein ACRD4V_13415 [Candidatus Acidiferrales bacterium]